MNVHIIMLIVWVAIAVLFFIGEIFTEGFALMWFGIGAVAGALFALLNYPSGRRFSLRWRWFLPYSSDSPGCFSKG